MAKCSRHLLPHVNFATLDRMQIIPEPRAARACRKWPIVHIVRGQSVRDFVVEGKTVPKDSTVIAALHGTMHDPVVYTDPDK